MRGAKTPVRRGESGLALLSALLAVALLTVIVVEFADTSILHARLSRNAGNAIAAQMLARSAITGAEDVFSDVDNKFDIPSNSSFPIPVSSGLVEITKIDEDGKLDLNQVSKDPNDPQTKAVTTLFGQLGLDDSLVERIAAWISPANAKGTTPSSAGDLCALPNCVPRGGPMRDFEELRLITGFDDAVLQALRDHVTVIPGGKGTTGVYPFSATPQVLSAIGCEKMEPAKNDSDKPDAKTACPNTPPKLLQSTRKTYTFRARAMVGDATQTVSAMDVISGGKVTRLTWHERPVSDLTPTEVP